MPEVTPEKAHEAKLLLQQAATEFRNYEAVQKIDWMKLIELLMQFIPLILTFFKPKDETPM